MPKLNNSQSSEFPFDFKYDLNFNQVSATNEDLLNRTLLSLELLQQIKKQEISVLYEITSDYDLEESTMNIPSNCILFLMEEVTQMALLTCWENACCSQTEMRFSMTSILKLQTIHVIFYQRAVMRCFPERMNFRF